MKTVLIWITALVLAASLSACGTAENETDIPDEDNTQNTEQQDPSDEKDELPPEHSPFYISGLSVDDVILYFNEVCLDAELVHGGEPSLLQKWTKPLRYILYGDPTEKDREVLAAFSEQLNAIEGFPGISETSEPAEANLTIHFCVQEEIPVIMGSDYVGVDGAVTFWYENNEIYSCIICCRTDIDQYLRNSVIQEEVYNGLGPIQDTSLREDSIAYSGFSEPQELTEIDELLLKLLYDQRLECGMSAAECEAVIRSIYY